MRQISSISLAFVSNENFVNFHTQWWLRAVEHSISVLRTSIQLRTVSVIDASRQACCASHSPEIDGCLCEGKHFDKHLLWLPRESLSSMCCLTFCVPKCSLWSMVEVMKRSHELSCSKAHKSCTHHLLLEETPSHIRLGITQCHLLDSLDRSRDNKQQELTSLILETPLPTKDSCNRL